MYQENTNAGSTNAKDKNKNRIRILLAATK